MRREGRGETAPPDDLRAAHVRIGGVEYVLMSFPRDAALVDALTQAERQVALAVLAGYSNTEIARMRGSAPRTVANQIASLFRKLGVRSRGELAANQLARR